MTFNKSVKDYSHVIASQHVQTMRVVDTPIWTFLNMAKIHQKKGTSSSSSKLLLLCIVLKRGSREESASLSLKETTDSISVFVAECKKRIVTNYLDKIFILGIFCMTVLLKNQNGHNGN